VNYCSKMLRCTKLDLSTLHQNGLNCPTSLWRSEPCGLCALAASTPEEAIIAAVNHSVDSDSTGLITGNIVGVILATQIHLSDAACCLGGQVESHLEDTV
jgi:hypothetical protein